MGEKGITPEEMEVACQGLRKTFDGGNFIVLGVKDGVCRYASDLTRETAVSVLKEWMIHHRYDENWMEEQG